MPRIFASTTRPLRSLAVCREQEISCDELPGQAGNTRIVNKERLENTFSACATACLDENRGWFYIDFEYQMDVPLLRTGVLRFAVTEGTACPAEAVPTSKPIYRGSLALLALLVVASVAQAQRLRSKRYKNGERIRAAFRKVVAKANLSTIAVYSDGKHVAMGTVVGAEGEVLTKASELKGNVNAEGHVANPRLPNERIDSSLSQNPRNSMSLINETGDDRESSLNG